MKVIDKVERDALVCVYIPMPIALVNAVREHAKDQGITVPALIRQRLQDLDSSLPADLSQADLRAQYRLLSEEAERVAGEIEYMQLLASAPADAAMMAIHHDTIAPLPNFQA